MIHGVTPADEKQGNHTVHDNPIVRVPWKRLKLGTELGERQ